MAQYKCLIVKNGDLVGALHDTVQAESEQEAIEAMKNKYPKYDTFSCYTVTEEPDLPPGVFGHPR
jgi:hypothetical protein